MTARDASKPSLRPKLLQPSPTRDTSRFERPRVVDSMARSYVESGGGHPQRTAIMRPWMPRSCIGALVSLVVVGCVAAVAAGASAAHSSPTAFRGHIAAISSSLARQMTGVSWHRGCPVGLSDLRAIKATYHGFDGHDHTGTLIVHRDVASQMLAVLRRLYAEGFPIRRMVPVDAYGGSDFRSIEADNTSAKSARP